MAKKEPAKVLTTPAARGAFVHLFEPKEGMNGGAPKYGITPVWTPAKFNAQEKQLWLAIRGELDRVSLEAFKMPWKALAGAGLKTGLRDGTHKEYEGFGPGTVFANLTSKFAPGVCDLKGNDIGPDFGNAELVYPGSLLRFKVNVYSYDQNGGRGVAIGIKSAQLLVSDETRFPRFDNRTSAKDDFADDEIDSSWQESYNEDGEDFAGAGGSFEDDDGEDIPF